MAPLLLLFASFAMAGLPIQLGLYAGAPEIHDTVAFELLEHGKATVTPDYFNTDGNKNGAPAKIIHGTWSYHVPLLTISYGPYKDDLRKENCPQKHSCFKFEKSYRIGVSPLNVPYGFGLKNSK